jgi:predicted esterase YcpF (UPF0227 family)
MKLIYFPGFGGSEKSNTFLNILLKYPDSQVIIYNNTDADEAFIQIENQLKNISTEIPIIIGQSLGGFWAEYFAIKHNLKLVLINPSFEPFKSLEKYNIPIQELEKFKKFKSGKIAKSKVSIILSKNDTVVNPTPVIAKYKNTVAFKYVDGDHKFTDYEILFNEIDSLLIA